MSTRHFLPICCKNKLCLKNVLLRNFFFTKRKLTKQIVFFFSGGSSFSHVFYSLPLQEKAFLRTKHLLKLYLCIFLKNLPYEKNSSVFLKMNFSRNKTFFVFCLTYEVFLPSFFSSLFLVFVHHVFAFTSFSISFFV